MRPKPSRRGKETGSAIVEAGLVLTLYLSLVLMIFDISVAMFLHQSLVSRAREAARWGAIHPSDLHAIANMVANQDPANSSPGYLGLNPQNTASISVTRTGTAGGLDDRIRIDVSGGYGTWITPGWAGQRYGRAVTVTMPVEN